MKIENAPLVDRRGSLRLACLRALLVSVVATVTMTEATGETLPFTVTLVESGWHGAPALQSFASASTDDGRWLLVGGRTTGLHGKQESGDSPGPERNFRLLNLDAWVVDPGVSSISEPLKQFAPGLAESLAVTNAQCCQVGDRLYIVGGYGRLQSETFGLGPIATSDNATFANLTVIDVQDTVDRITVHEPAGNAIRQSAPHPFLQVTGGELAYADGVFYLVFGHNFTGNYTQQGNGAYTFQVRAFTVSDDGFNPPIVTEVASFGSEMNESFRRRDMNLVPSRSRADESFLTVYGGVFTKQSGVWHEPIYIFPGGPATTVVEDSGFHQQMCQYNCATLPLWSDGAETNYTVFFGGISEVWATPSGFRRDLAVPFIRQVTCVQREANETPEEFLVTREEPWAEGVSIPLQLPALMGASAEFIPITDDELWRDGILDVDALPAEPTLVGRVYGGIRASTPNDNFGTSIASDLILDVYVAQTPSAAIPVEPPAAAEEEEETQAAVRRDRRDMGYDPRIHFTGTFVCNSGTANNNDVWDVFTDVDTIEFAEPFQFWHDGEIRRALFDEIPIGDHVFVNGGWNPFGDQSTHFLNASIVSVRRADGETTSDDPIVGQFVNILGEAGNVPVIVMTNPQGGVGSQLFIGGLSISNNPDPRIPLLPEPTTVQLLASHNTRAYTRWTGVRNWAEFNGENGYTPMATNWQFAIPAEALKTPVEPPPGSVLADLLEAAQPHGLLVQFTCTQMKPRVPNAPLIEMFDQGQFVSNAAEGFLVGSILVRRPDDRLETAINGRRLEPAERPLEPERSVGVAAVTIDTKHQEVTLNLIDGIPECGFPTDPKEQKKVGFGTLYLGVTTPDDETRIIGTMVHEYSTDPPSYGYEYYAERGGIVDFSYEGSTDITDEVLRNGRLQILTDSEVLLEETPVRVVSDDHAHYLAPNGTTYVTLDVMRRDFEATLLYLWEFEYELVPGVFDTSRTTANRKLVTENHRLEFPRIVRVPAGETTVTFPVSARRAGPATIAYTLDPSPPPNGDAFPRTTGFYTRFRVWPDDSPAGPVTTEDLFDRVFRYYTVIFPAMGEKIIHTNAPELLDNGARGLLGRTDPALFHRTLYMPRTRDLSPGKRELMRRWVEETQPP